MRASEAVQGSELLRAVTRGDEQAFARFFDGFAPAVLGYLSQMLGGSRSEAEDLLQEVFLQVWQQADRYRPERASPKGWVMMIARSRALDRLRSQKARERRELTALEGGADSEAPVGTHRLESRERATALDGLLRALPPEQRQCVELAFFSRMSQSQMAEHLGLPLGTVKSRFLLGMRKLREALVAGG